MERKMRLPAGWYPQSGEEIDEYLRDSFDKKSSGANAVIAPHAGWFFSGKIAGIAVSSLRSDADTIIVAGGHLPAGSPILFAEEDVVCTPIGEIKIDGELRSLVKKELECTGMEFSADKYTDNTVEALLPAVHRFFPKARILWLRLGADKLAFAIGGLIARAAASLNRTAVMIGSTDLTHYGPNYDFYPKGLGEPAIEWVKDVNDRRFIEAVIAGGESSEDNIDEVLERALNEKSACSAGAVLCAMGFNAQIRETMNVTEAPEAKLLAYTTSADILQKSVSRDRAGLDSFVGYAAISFT
ncbi:MAG: AmmeMemoRadiSam system protein B [Treponema sp.]|jgi:AmmeMemoRadiSam system protein B|nr:AmmeMemoRadiSam system protein B [Treponema sp.]